jgi:hypothetical protein
MNPNVEETLHWYAFNYRQAHTSQAHEMWLELEQFVDRKMKAPQRTWVGLTDEEAKEVWKQLNYDFNHGKFAADDTESHVIVEFYRAIETKLKERSNA